MKKAPVCLCLFVAIALACLPAATAAQANSAQMYFDASAPFELVAVDSKDVSVTSEELIFEVDDSDNRQTAPTVRVKASYSMHNAAEAHTALIGFPYLASREWEEPPLSEPMVELNGQPLTAKKLYGSDNYDNIDTLDFDTILQDINALNQPAYDKKCTLYTFIATENRIEVSFDKAFKDIAYFTNFMGFRTDKNGKQYLFASTSNTTNKFQLLVIDDEVTPQVTGGTYNAHSMSVGEYLDGKQCDREYANSRINCALRDRGKDMKKAYIGELYQVGYDVLVLLQYTADFVAGDNRMSVSYSAYPCADYSYAPELYTFNYISLPASRWAGFENLSVTIKTDLFVKSDVIDLTKTDDGYTAFSGTLPEKNISFTLCASDAPVYNRPKNHSGHLVVLWNIVWIVISLILAASVTIILGIVLTRRKKNKKSRK